MAAPPMPLPRMATTSSDRRHAQRAAATRPPAPGILLGIGLGGFVDGIVLHQILQWHHMLSSEGGYPKTTVAGLKENMLADGLFHAFTWVVVVGGLGVLWRRTNDWRWAASGRALIGWTLLGWGPFNVVEGLVTTKSSAFITSAKAPDTGRPTIWASSPSARYSFSAAGSLPARASVSPIVPRPDSAPRISNSLAIPARSRGGGVAGQHLPPLGCGDSCAGYACGFKITGHVGRCSVRHCAASEHVRDDGSQGACLVMRWAVGGSNTRPPACKAAWFGRIR